MKVLVMLTVVNLAHVPAATVHKMQEAVSVQYNTQVAPVWTPHKRIRFGGGGYPVYLVDRQTMLDWCTYGIDVPVLACHERRAAYVSIQGHQRSWENSFSHEVIESTTDRNLGWRYLEICDRSEKLAHFDHVGLAWYMLDGVTVANWVLPDGRDYARS